MIVGASELTKSRTAARGDCHRFSRPLLRLGTMPAAPTSLWRRPTLSLRPVAERPPLGATFRRSVPPDRTIGCDELMFCAFEGGANQRQKSILDPWFVAYEPPTRHCKNLAVELRSVVYRRGVSTSLSLYAYAVAHLFVSNPCVGRRFVDACDPQTPDALLRELFAESPSALQTRPGSLNLAHGARLLEGVPGHLTTARSVPHNSLDVWDSFLDVNGFCIEARPFRFRWCASMHFHRF